jgi:hypothetical protein
MRSGARGQREEDVITDKEEALIQLLEHKPGLPLSSDEEKMLKEVQKDLNRGTLTNIASPYDGNSGLPTGWMIPSNSEVALLAPRALPTEGPSPR